MRPQRLLSLALAVIAAALMASCGQASVDGTAHSAALPASIVVRHEGLPCIDRQAARIRQTLVRIDAIALYRKCAPEFRRALGPLARRIDTIQFKAAFATAVANRYAPYGPSHALMIPELRRARTMNCANYVAVVFWVYRNLGGPVGNARFMGFDHGAIGNHAQLWFGSMLSDPTAGLIALAPLHGVLDGQRAAIVVDVSGRPEDPPGFREKVTSALVNGLYRARDVIYAQSPQQYLHRTHL